MAWKEGEFLMLGIDYEQSFWDQKEVEFENVLHIQL